LAGRFLRKFKPVEPGPGMDELPDLRALGRQLYAQGLGGDVGVALLRSLDWAQERGRGLRIRLRLAADAAELAELPWEYLYAPLLERFVALSDNTVVVRYIEPDGGTQDDRLQALQVEYPLRILGVVADPIDVERLDVEREWRLIQEALTNLEAGGLVTLERLPQATMQAVRDRLRTDDVHLLHFIGHGYFDADSDEGGLVLEDDRRQARQVNAGDLAVVLHDRRNLRLLFLNACHGAATDRSDAYAGTAQTLVRQGVPAVVAMQFAISDRAAITLARDFYSALATGAAVDTALAQARKAIYDLDKMQPEWGTPVLFSAAADNRILALPSGDARPIIDTQPFEPQTVRIAPGPFTMGSAPGDDIPVYETPAHMVSLPAYRIGVYPVTNAQYAEFLHRARDREGKEAAVPPGWFLGRPPAGKENHPVGGVRWRDAMDYCRWLARVTGRAYRLASEAEWEKAARGTDGRRYPWGQVWQEGCCNAGGSATTPVDSYPSGASAYGCLDMLGNVEEWTSTLWGSDPLRPAYGYPYQAGDGREDSDGGVHRSRAHRICRGGSYRDAPADLRCAARSAALESSAVKWRGFRVVMGLET
jgi:formylglycine-generating enzyme required for sulfatase activity